MHRTIVVADVVGFGDPRRNDRDRVTVRAGLYRMLEEVLESAGVPWSLCDHEDRGDGVLVVIPPSVAKSVLVESVPPELESRLVAHNASHGAEERIRLRVALHAGEIQYDEHGVVGTAVNHAYRLLDSDVFRAALAGSAGVLGVITSSWFFHEVVWNCRPETRAAYFSVRVTAKETNTVAWICLSDRAPAPPVSGPVPRQLPPRGRQFVGRRQELDQLTELLDAAVPEAGTVIITAIAGTAGIGKTALAMHWAHQAKDRFPDGQLHVDLRGFDPQAPVDPSQALYGFLEALGVVPSGIPSDLDARAALYRSLVADRRMLIMLDNAASARDVRPLLPNTPTCFVIVTSRDRLDSLVVREGAYRIAVDVLPTQDALELLAQRITRERLDAEPDAAAALVDLCARLPLALSIVAARAADQPLHHLVRQLRDERNRLDALDLGEADLSVRTVYSWSYRALSPQAARLFRLLGIHPGPDIDQHACAALIDPPANVLRELTNAHLLEEHRPGRFRFHDLLRAYAAECAESEEPAPERHAAMRRIIDHYIRVASLADYLIHPFRGGEVRVTPLSNGVRVINTYSDAMNWFLAENSTLLSVISFAAQHGFDNEVGQLAWAFEVFLSRVGQRNERVAVNRMALAAARRMGDRAMEGTFLRELARGTARLGNFDEAMRYLEKAHALIQMVGDQDDKISIQLSYVRVLELQYRHEEALRYAWMAWHLAQGRASELRHAKVITAIGSQHAWLGRWTEALPWCESALEIYSRIGHPEGEANVLNALGFIHLGLGRHAQAIAYYQRSLMLNRQRGARYWESFVLDRLGDVYDAAGEHQSAQHAWQEALAILDTLHHPEAEPVRAKLVRS